MKKRKLEKSNNNLQENDPELEERNESVDMWNDFLWTLINEVFIEKNLSLYNHLAEKEDRLKLFYTNTENSHKQRGFFLAKSLYNKHNDRQYVELSDIKFKYFFPKKEPEYAHERIFYQNIIRSLNFFTLSGIAIKYWPLLPLEEGIPKKKSLLENWLFDCIFRRVPDKAKRKMEGENMNQINREYLPLYLCKILIPVPVMIIVYSFMRRSRTLLNGIAMANENYYIFTLLNWGKVRTDTNVIDRIPLPVLSGLRELEIKTLRKDTLECHKNFLGRQFGSINKLIVKGPNAGILMGHLLKQKYQFLQNVTVLKCLVNFVMYRKSCEKNVEVEYEFSKVKFLFPKLREFSLTSFCLFSNVKYIAYWYERPSLKIQWPVIPPDFLENLKKLEIESSSVDDDSVLQELLRNPFSLPTQEFNLPEYFAELNIRVLNLRENRLVLITKRSFEVIKKMANLQCLGVNICSQNTMGYFIEVMSQMDNIQNLSVFFRTSLTEISNENSSPDPLYSKNVKNLFVCLNGKENLRSFKLILNHSLECDNYSYVGNILRDNLMVHIIINVLKEKYGNNTKTKMANFFCELRKHFFSKNWLEKGRLKLTIKF